MKPERKMMTTSKQEPQLIGKKLALNKTSLKLPLDGLPDVYSSNTFLWDVITPVSPQPAATTTSSDHVLTSVGCVAPDPVTDADATPSALAPTPTPGPTSGPAPGPAPGPASKLVRTWRGPGGLRLLPDKAQVDSSSSLYGPTPLSSVSYPNVSGTRFSSLSGMVGDGGEDGTNSPWYVSNMTGLRKVLNPSSGYGSSYLEISSPNTTKVLCKEMEFCSPRLVEHRIKPIVSSLSNPNLTPREKESIQVSLLRMAHKVSRHKKTREHAPERH